MFSFIHILTTYGNSLLKPEWVLYSLFIEIAQDAKYRVQNLAPKIVSYKTTENLFAGKFK